MTTVAQLLAVKGHEVVSVSPSSTVYDAIQLMADKNIGALAVLDTDHLVGIFTERDLVTRVLGTEAFALGAEAPFTDSWMAPVELFS